MSSSPSLSKSAMARRYERYPRLMFQLRRLQRVNYEREMTLLDLLCDRSRTSVDIGAKLGMYTHRLLRHSREVVSFEPIPVLARMLRRVFAGQACRIEQCALSDTPGKVEMRIPFGSNGEVKFGRSTIEATNALEHDDVGGIERIEVEVKTLDQHDLQGVGFIKIDVEGHELSVLGGARGTLARERPNLLIESNEHHHPGAVAGVRELLAGLGYQGHFLRRRRLASLAGVDVASLTRDSIENFIFVHESRPEVVERLVARVGRA